jgi:competence protein ComGF
MYDERAVGTEDTTTFDLEVIEEILKTVPLANIDFGQQTQNEAGATIGNIQTKILSNSGTTITGTTSMTQIMNDLIDATKVYTDTTVSVLENINSSYLIGGLRMFTKDRKFITGNFGEYASNMSDNVSTNIFGKADTLQSKIDQLFSDAISDVSNNTSPLLVGFTNNSRNVTNKDLRIFKKNLTTVIENKKKNFSAIMETKLNDLVTKEQELIRVVDKINFVQTETDGFKRGGTPIIYGLTATTEVNETSTGANNTLEEFVNDYKTVANNINTFYTNLGTNNIMTADWDNSLSFSFLNESINTSAQKRWCLIFSQEILTNKTQFGLDCLGPELQKIPVWSDGVNADLNTLSVDYQNSLAQSTKLFTDFKNNYYNSVFNLYQPYIRTKTRLFEFNNLPSPNPAQIDNFNLLYSGVNSKGPNWNNKIKLD